jgi:cupin fold WbuC family metalloprotein
MERIYSKINKNILLLSIIKYSDITQDRIDLSPPTETLQASVKKLTKGKKFKIHKHNKLERKTTNTQESWVFLQGKVRATFYDLDDTLIVDTVLSAGDCVVVFQAGHGFEVLEENTIIYEFKNGPYYGIKMDKTFINKKQ